MNITDLIMKNNIIYQEQGWFAFYSGYSLSDNPYEKNDVRFYKWREGYKAAKTEFSSDRRSSELIH